mgnify:FL=1|tara:strand:+ start:800 stop:1006 length:207 start_codon:yes stop_codon:yes gene_type:complete
MIINNAKYFQRILINNDSGSVSADGVNQGVVASIDGVTMHVPLDPANTDYAEILRQVAAGTLTIEDAD